MNVLYILTSLWLIKITRRNTSAWWCEGCIATEVQTKPHTDLQMATHICESATVLTFKIAN